MGHIGQYWFATTLLVAIAVINSSAHAATSVNVQVLSATVKDQKIEGATAILQKNGEQSVSSTSNLEGRASLSSTFADDSASLLIIKKEGYSDLIVKCPCSGLTYALSTKMINLDGMRIVLNWGNTPQDLDSHLVTLSDHVFFIQRLGADISLDVDDRDGYGPETITISRKYDGKRYIYAVHDFTNTNHEGASELARSGAKVFIYVGQTLVRTYYVPTNVSGNLWTVFALSETGEIIDINSLTGVANDLQLGASALSRKIFDTTKPKTLTNIQASNSGLHSTINPQSSAPAAKGSIQPANSTQAQTLNKQGENAYHAGNLDESIQLYQTAIELDSNYGQAYSNLGLSFQKAGRAAEAMWANRKAIALATGPNAATVRASSHFNNGKIYEAAEQWADALREYQYAKNEKANPVYDKAIQRMKEKK